MNIRENFDLSAYLVVGPENTKERPVREIVTAAIKAGFTFIQIRSKIASAIELIELTRQTAGVISKAGKTEQVALVVDDRLDVVLAARKLGIKVDGIHVGQKDIPVEICREYLGEKAIVGLSAKTGELFDCMRTVDFSKIDYFGAGPLHKTATKLDCGLDSLGNFRTRSLEELTKLKQLSPIPVVVGGGVKKIDLPQLAQTKVDGFFVVSAVAEADNPLAAAIELVEAWKSAK